MVLKGGGREEVGLMGGGSPSASIVWPCLAICRCPPGLSRVRASRVLCSHLSQGSLAELPLWSISLSIIYLSCWPWGGTRVRRSSRVRIRHGAEAAQRVQACKSLCATWSGCVSRPCLIALADIHEKLWTGGRNGKTVRRNSGSNPPPGNAPVAPPPSLMRPPQYDSKYDCSICSTLR